LSYAFRASEKTRGTGMSDVILFQPYMDKIFTAEELEKLYIERDEFEIPALRELKKVITNASIQLEYGQRIMFPTNPIRYSIAPGLGVSSSDKQEMAEFSIEKYWPDDTDANKYKVKLSPVENTGRIPYEKVYSSDLKQMLFSGVARFAESN